MQKAIQQNAKKTANHLRGYRTDVLRKISAVKVRTGIASESARQTFAQNWRQLPARVAHCAPMAQKFSPEANSLRNLASRPKKMNSATQRNRFYAKRHPEQMKRHPFCRKMGSSMCLRFKPFRRQLSTFPIMILEITSS